MSIIIAILILGFLIFFHEFGHFLAAKLCNTGVLEFSIGMGPRIFSKVWRNTRYSLKLLPIGGSCAMLGEDAAGSGDFSSSDGEVHDEYIDYDGVKYKKSEIKDYNFQNKSSYQRFFICIAGVLFNIILAYIASLFIVAKIGFDVPVIDSTMKNAPVAESGIKNGDIILSISSGAKEKSVHSIRDIRLYTFSHGEDLEKNGMEIEVLRDGQKLKFKSLPYYNSENDIYMLGIKFKAHYEKPENALALFRDAYYEIRSNIVMVTESLKLLLKGRVSKDEVMGPVGVVSAMGNTVSDSSRYGIMNTILAIVDMMAMLSANLAVMNLLPIPALDGGRLLFILGEIISRKRLNPKIEENINRVGMVLLLVLMAFIMGNDIRNLIIGRYF